jgi:alpha-L-rhamnosidase
VLHSDFGWSGSFTSSHEMLNQLQSNINWGLRGNFLESPPTARSATSGSAGPATPRSSLPRRSSTPMSFVPRELARKHAPRPACDGAIPNVVPNILNDRCGGPGWSDAATVIPWETISAPATGVLEENFDMMRRWVGWYESQAKDAHRRCQAYGDWLQPYPKAGGNQGRHPARTSSAPPTSPARPT